MAYATPADLASFLQVPSVDTATATLILQMAADAMDAECGQPLGHQDVAGLLVDGTGASRVVLPGVPVTSVTSVEILDRDGAWQLLAEGADYTWSASGVLTRCYNLADPQGAVELAWPSRQQSIRVSYGYGPAGSAAPGAKTVNLALAARMWPNPMGLTAEHVGGIDLRYAKDALAFTPMELRILGRLTDPVIA